MNTIKNIAGNDVSIFLFRFEIVSVGISFVLNEEIAADMYQDLEEKLLPLAHACCETLARYRHLSVSTTIMDGNILDTGEFEVMLSKGLGRHFVDDEKQLLFQDAKTMADILIAVMDRKTKELKDGNHHPSSHTRSPPIPNTIKIKQGLEKLGHAKSAQAELRWIIEGTPLRPNLKRLRPEDLPPGVTAARGYDHRGHCLIFEHKTLGELGKIVLIKIREGKMMIQAELYTGQKHGDDPLIHKKKNIFKKVVATVNNHFNEQFPD